MTRLAVIVSTFGYIGFFPVAPGTAGSAAGLAVYCLVRVLGLGVPEAITILLLFVAGIASGTRAERHFGAVDPGPVVIDEVMGMLITLSAIPVGWGGALIGFVLFRILDVVKPYPASRLERLSGGLGIMADDGIVAIYANLVLRVLWWLAPGWIT